MAQLTPKDILEISEPIEQIYQRTVDELLINIATHFKVSGWERTRYWEIKKLSELGALTKESVEIIAKNTGMLPEEVEKAFLQVSEKACLDIDPQLREAAEKGLLQDPGNSSTTSPEIRRMVRAFSEQAIDKMNLTNATMLESTRQAYQKAVQQVATEEQLEEAKQILETQAFSVTTGAETRTRAIRKAMNDLSRTGLTGFVDRAGRHWQPEAYAAMVVRTTAHNAAIESIKTRQQEFGGGDVFQISSHPGARPLCAPYQGGLYSWSGSGVFVDGDGKPHQYEDIRDTSYGEAAGIFGINCGHHPIPMISGFSFLQEGPTQTPEENAKEYEESQKQRQYERDIREAKRELEIAKATGDGEAIKAAKQRVAQEQARMRAYINETGRARRYDREQIGTAKPLQTEAVKARSGPDFGPAVSGLNDERRMGVTERLEKAPKEIRDAWNAVSDRLQAPKFDLSSGAHFDPSDGATHYENEAKAFGRSSYQEEYVVYFHEYGHNIDYLMAPGYQFRSVTYKDGAFGKKLQEECEKNVVDFFVHKTGASSDPYDLIKKEQDGEYGIGMRSYIRQALRHAMGSDEYRSIRSGLMDAPEERYRELFDKYLRDNESVQADARSIIKRAMKQEDTGKQFADYVNSSYTIYQRSDVSDMYDQYMSNEYNISYPFGVGHGADYWKLEEGTSRLAMEAFAEMYSATATKNESLSVIKEFFPESYKIFMEMLQDEV